MWSAPANPCSDTATPRSAASPRAGSSASASRRASSRRPICRTRPGGTLDPFRASAVMMAGEKPGGHGERCVAVGALDMAVWDAAAKIAGLPLHRFIAERLGRPQPATPRVRVYAGGGYRYPRDDIALLSDEMRRFVDLGFTHAKMKIGGAGLDQDRRRIEAAAAQLPGARNLAVDAMNAYDAETGSEAAALLSPFGLWWFEDICDPLDFETQAHIAAAYEPPIAAGEALFSLAEAKLLDRHGGLRRGRDVLVFDAVHCYGLCRLSRHRRRARVARLAAQRLLAAWRPPFLAPCRRSARSRRLRGLPLRLPSFRRPRRRDEDRGRPCRIAGDPGHRLRAEHGDLGGNFASFARAADAWCGEFEIPHWDRAR